MKSKSVFSPSRRSHRLRVLQVGLAAILTMLSWSLSTSPVFADADGSVVETAFSNTGTINEGDSEFFTLNLQASPLGNESGGAGTTTRNLNANTMSFSAPGSTAGSSNISVGAVGAGGTQSFNGSFQYLQNGTYTISASGSPSFHWQENASYGTGNPSGDQANGISDSRTFTVLNVAPTITSANQDGTNGNISVAQGSTVGLNLTATDPGADTISFTINGGSAGTDPATSGTRTSSTVNETYYAVGVYTNTFQATDQDGANASNGPVTRTVTVTNVAPQNLNLTLGSYTIYEGDTTLAQMTATDPGPDTLTFTIDGHAAGSFAGAPGSTRTSNNVTLGAYSIAGASQVFNIVGSVSDGNGGTSTTSVNLTVLHAAAVIDAISVLTMIPVPSGGLVSIHTDAHSPGLHTLQYAYDFDGGGLSSFSLSPDSVLGFLTAGTHSVDVHVYDGVTTTVGSYTFEVIPEPASVVLAGLGGVLALAMFRRKRSK